MIRLEGVQFAYGRKGPMVIQPTTLILHPNEITALIGPNGCGKTTLGKLMAGILKPDAGTVHVDEMETKTTELSELGHHVGYLFQEPERQLFASTVRDELSFVFDLMGESKELYSQRVDQMMQRFHLLELANDFPFQLSRGEKQRLAIAAVMIQDPAFYIFDEPTTGLDDVRRKELSAILADLADRGKGMLMISHDRSFIQRHAQRIIRMEGGRIVEDRIIVGSPR